MTTNRDTILHRVRALLAKTVANGATEAEALSALTKAQAIMDEYQVTEEDLKLTREEEEAVFGKRSLKNDYWNLRLHLGKSVGEFFDCMSFRGVNHVFNKKGRLVKEYDIVFVGLKSDVDMAHWLLESLVTFIKIELKKFLIANPCDGRLRLRYENGFTHGIKTRIVERLEALINEARAKKNGNNQALIVIKQDLITRAMEGMEFKPSRSSRVRVNVNAIRAGREAGDRATFARGVGGSPLRLS